MQGYSVAQQGRVKESLPTHPRDPMGNPLPLLPMAIGGWQAGADMTTVPVGGQQSALKPGNAHLLHPINYW